MHSNVIPYTEPATVLGFLEGLPDARAMSPHSRPPSEKASVLASQLSSHRSRRPADWDPTSPKITGGPHLHAPTPRNGNGSPRLDNLNYAGSPAPFANELRDDDADSNVQDGLRSELGDLVSPLCLFFV